MIFESDRQNDAKAVEDICSTAPFPNCNGANGCDSCEHQKDDFYFDTAKALTRGLAEQLKGVTSGKED